MKGIINVRAPIPLHATPVVQGNRSRKYIYDMILIKEIDDDGDAAIKFEAWKCELWVFEGDLNKLKKIQAVRP